MKLSIGLLGLALFLATVSMALAASDKYEKGLFRHNVNGFTNDLPYRILFPKDFNKNQDYPLVVFLHGAGERGNDNKAQLTHGSSLFLSEDFREKHQVITVFPQAAADDYWVNVDVDRAPDPNIYNFKVDAPLTPSMSSLLALIDEMSLRPYVNNSQMLIMGLSMGGMGTYEVLAQRPGLFRAAIAICGGAHKELVNKMDVSVPIWAFHGDADNVVPFSASETIVQAYEQAGGNIRFTRYKGIAHNSWDNAFAEPDLLDWLLSHKR